MEEQGCEEGGDKVDCAYTKQAAWAVKPYPPEKDEEYYGRGPFQLS